MWNVTGTRGEGNYNIETKHYVSAVVMNHQGEMTWQWGGEPSDFIFLRSAAKPFQAFAVYQTLSSETQTNLKSEEFALMSSSHGGTDTHIAWVQQLLARAGLTEKALKCHPHLPKEFTARRQLLLKSQSPSALHHNCSGKHAGMLLACIENNWPIDSYWEANHPLQQKILALLQHYSLPHTEITIAIDGCGVPVHGMSLANAAFLYSQLGSRVEFSKLIGVIKQFPVLIGDVARIDTNIMQLTEGRLLCKVGADGVIALSRPSTQEGLVLKLWDGNELLRNRFILAVLQELSWLRLDEYPLLISRFPHWSLERRNDENELIGAYQIEWLR